MRNNHANDFAALKRAAAGQWPSLIAQLGGCSGDILDGRHHPCPKCGGTDRFRLLDVEAGAVFCNQCFADHNGDGIAAVAWLRGCSVGEAAGLIAARLGVPWKGGTAKGKDGASPVFANFAAVVRHLVRTCTPRGEQAAGCQGQAKLARVDRYGDAFAVLRIDVPTPPGEKQRKSFRPVHPIALADGRRALKLGYPDGAGLRPLFCQAELDAAPDTTLVVIVGGEKCVQVAQSIGLTATTCAGGERAVAKTDWAPVARFAVAAIPIDNDDTGVAYGEAVSAAVRRVAPGCKVKVIRLPGLPPKGDIAEWVAAGGTGEEFRRLAGAAEEHVADRLAVDRAICEAIQVDVLGELPDRKVKVFSMAFGKNVVIDRISRLDYCDMLQAFGPIVREKIHEKKEDIPGLHHITRVKQALAMLAGAERAGTEAEVGQGVWLGDVAADGTQRVVLVGAGQAAVWDGRELTTVRKPRAAGLKIDMDMPGDTQWFQPDRLAGYLDAAADVAPGGWCAQVFDDTATVFKNWYWKAEAGVGEEVVAALAMATWVQSAWAWRPMVSITGASDSGKSTLFETLETLFGPLALLNSKSTEAGIRQSVANRSRVILCDEFESDKHRKGILELFRTSSKGSKTLRGTMGQISREYGLRHIPWVTAIEVGLQRAPDRNRFIMLEMDTPPKGKRGVMHLPTPAELEDLGQRILAVAVRHVARAVAMAERIKSVQVEGIHGRVVESFATPVAMAAVAQGIDDDSAAELLRLWVTQLDQDPMQGTKDETELLGDILASIVDLTHGRKATVAQILAQRDECSDWMESLERVGIATVASTHTPRNAGAFEPQSLFIACKPVLRHLLKATQWEGQSIETLLRRIPGALRSQRRVGGSRPWGIEIPMDVLKKFLAPDGRLTF